MCKTAMNVLMSIIRIPHIQRTHDDDDGATERLLYALKPLQYASLTARYLSFILFPTLDSSTDASFHASLTNSTGDMQAKSFSLGD
jgi:hypothetical protein